MKFRINDMTCGRCATKVKNAILMLDPDAVVMADPTSRLVNVDSLLSRELIAEALQEAGFPPHEQ
ncbi:TPA: heavy-metal-associated domain-containing protein [Citrobacter freundii]|nr:heavy-metal-associated domain-containing protein [Salmonella enterica subsp. enterica serovar Havana]EKB5678747.1 heavy-metal-associated domain-containing protein [Salmonella enterica]